MEPSEDFETLPAQIAALASAAVYAAEPDEVRAALRESIGRFLQGVKGWLAAIDARHDAGIASAHAEWKTRLAAKKAEAEIALGHELRLKAAYREYAAVEERKARELEAALAAQARREAEEARFVDAAAAEAAGDSETADAILAAPIAPAPVVVARASVDGVQVRRRWAWRLVAAARLKPEFLKVDEKAIAAVVAQLGPRAVGAVGYGAIEVYEDHTVAVRRGGR